MYVHDKMMYNSIDNESIAERFTYKGERIMPSKKPAGDFGDDEMEFTSDPGSGLDGFGLDDSAPSTPIAGTASAADASTTAAVKPPKVPREVKIFNGITTTAYNQLRKATGDTPKRVVVKRLTDATKAALSNGTMKEVTDTAINDLVPGAFDLAQTHDATVVTWWNNIGERAKRRVYNEIRTAVTAAA